MQIEQNLLMISLHSSPVGTMGTRDTGGMSTTIVETASALRTKGYTIDILTLSGSTSTSVVEISENIRLIQLGVDTGCKLTKETLYAHLQEVFAAFTLFYAQEQKTYLLVHSHYWISAALGQMLVDSIFLPHVITFHTLGAAKNSSCPEENEPQKRIENEKLLAGSCNRVVAFTREEKFNLKQMYQAPDDNITVIPCGVNTSRFKRVDDARKQLPLDIHENELMLLYVGRVVPVKGADILIKALELIELDQAITLVIVGGDETKRSSFAQNDKTEPAGSRRIIQTGSVNHQELPLYYSAADALVVPSYHESFSLVTLEALACGIPVIGSGVGCLPEVIVPGGGLVVYGHSSSEFANAIGRFFDSNNTKPLSPEQIRESIKDYSWQKSADDLHCLYQAILTDQGVVN